MAFSKKAKIILGSVGAAVVIIIIFIATSISVVGPTEVGLQYNLNNFQLNEQRLFTPGRYFIGFNQIFVIFPSDLQYVKFSSAATQEEEEEPTAPSLPARTLDGLRVTLSLSFQYRLRQSTDDIVGLYRNFSTKYEETYVRIARDVVRNVAADFRAFAFFEERNVVEQKMRLELNEKLVSLPFWLMYEPKLFVAENCGRKY
mmetsp:Transcript_9503/g.25793  ORF Transcript_9503/g.25793 Transcript_9503/m.25793 type:complete len:201 (-) Transcript_9503:2436-3038(-)